MQRVVFPVTLVCLQFGAIYSSIHQSSNLSDNHNWLISTYTVLNLSYKKWHVFECPTLEQKYRAECTNQWQLSFFFFFYPNKCPICIKTSQRIWALPTFYIKLKETTFDKGCFRCKGWIKSANCNQSTQHGVTPISSLSLQKQPDLFIWYYDRKALKWHWAMTPVPSKGGKSDMQSI